jgi:hypothetical protein
MDSALYNEKFICVNGPELGLPFGHRRLICCVLVSTSSLLVAVCVNPADSNSSSSYVTKCLGGQRTRVMHADITFLHDGKLVVATSNGSPQHPINVHSVHPSIGEENELKLSVGNFPSIFLQSSDSSNPNGKQGVKSFCNFFPRTNS